MAEPRVVARWTDDRGFAFELLSDGSAWGTPEGFKPHNVEDPAGLGPRLARLVLDVEAMPCAVYLDARETGMLCQVPACRRCAALARVRE